jgi:hypothetical protein
VQRRRSAMRPEGEATRLPTSRLSLGRWLFSLLACYHFAGLIDRLRRTALSLACGLIDFALGLQVWVVGEMAGRFLGPSCA